ncbi:hypothetical protein [Mesomycoplasma ovipneumoniae]|uniref:hypothetical protein n=1 Tax=Mesomycoplasma ovipneumoniae TaxID=29562 RepID=UPI00311B4033
MISRFCIPECLVLKSSVLALIVIFPEFAKKVKKIPKTGHFLKIISSNWETRDFL